MLLTMQNIRRPKLLCAVAILQDCSAGREKMVYCTKCGNNNADGAAVCVNCGAPLEGASGESRPYVRHGNYEREYGYRRRGTPVIGIFIGLIIIFAGFALLVSEVYGVDIPWGPIIIIFIGVFVLARLLQVRSRRR